MYMMEDRLGETIREARLEKGWSREALLKHINNKLSLTTIRNIETGRTNPTSESVDILMRALNLRKKIIRGEG